MGFLLVSTCFHEMAPATRSKASASAGGSKRKPSSESKSDKPKRKRSAAAPAESNSATSAAADTAAAAEAAADAADAADAATAGGGAPSWEETADAPFPRGGGRALSALEYRQVAQEAKAEALFDEGDAATAGTLPSSAPSAVSSLKLTEIMSGARLLCAISEVSSTRLKVQLPNLFVGVIQREQISDEIFALATNGGKSANGGGGGGGGGAAHLPDLRKLFRVGELLSAVALPASALPPVREGGSAQPLVPLTLRLSVVNKVVLKHGGKAIRKGALVWATLKSEEAHGAIMELGGGPKSGNAFLHKKQARKNKQSLGHVLDESWTSLERVSDASRTRITETHSHVHTRFYRRFHARFHARFHTRLTQVLRRFHASLEHLLAHTPPPPTHATHAPSSPFSSLTVFFVSPPVGRRLWERGQTTQASPLALCCRQNV